MRDGDVRDRAMGECKQRSRLVISVKTCLSAVCLVCEGETPHMTSGEVYVDIDDEAPLMPDQVGISFEIVP